MCTWSRTPRQTWVSYTIEENFLILLWENSADVLKKTGKTTKNGSHFLLVLKLDRVLKWVGVKNRITTSYDIALKFRDFRGYYPTHMYVTKKDLLYLLSYSHPTEIESPQIAQPTEKRSELAEKQESCDTPSAINKRKENFSPQIYTTL